MALYQQVDFRFIAKQMEQEIKCLRQELFTLLMSFDPFTNEEVMEVLGQMDTGHLHEYYKAPVMCLLRIKDSVDTWEKRGGSDGYFNFIEQYMGAQINDDKMNFSVMMGGEADL